MGLYTDSFLAWRYFKPKRNLVSVITTVSLIGVILGVTVLIVVLSVMRGFADMIDKDLLKVTPHLELKTPDGKVLEEPYKLVDLIDKAGAKAMPVTMNPALIQYKNSFLPYVVLGVDTSLKISNEKLGDKIVRGRFPTERYEAVISEQTAQELLLSIGDKILIHSPTKLAKMIRSVDGETFTIGEDSDIYLPDEFKICGIYNYKSSRFENNILFVNLDDADLLFDMDWDTATSIYIWTENPHKLESLTDKILPKARKIIGVNDDEKIIYTWRELNSELMVVLDVERNMMFFLLVFILLVAAFSITNTLIILVVQKTREIGLLKSIGASSGSILNIFVLQGFYVGLIGTTLGVASGLFVVKFRKPIMNTILKISGQSNYILNNLPARLAAEDMVLIIIISVTLCTVGGIIPALLASKLDPAKSLRYE